jgi:hypothetical protein
MGSPSDVLFFFPIHVPISCCHQEGLFYTKEARMGHSSQIRSDGSRVVSMFWWPVNTSAISSLVALTLGDLNFLYLIEARKI